MRGTVLSIIGNIASVRLASGEVLTGVRVTGGASVGSDVALRYERGQYVALGEASGGFASGVVLSGAGGGVGSGVYVPLSRSITTTNGITGGGTLAADLTLQVDGTVARQGWPVNAGLGMSGGGGLSAGGVTLTVDLAYTFGWTATHTFNAGAKVSGTQVIEFGAGVAGKQTDAGKIGYGTFTAGALDIVGAGTGGSNRIVKLWDHTHIVGYIGSEAYTSQSSGWRITSAGGGDFRYLFTDEMHAKSFIADLEQALAGGQIISKSVAMLGKPFTAPAAGASATLWPRDLPSAPNMAVFQTGDIVRVRTFSRSGGSLSISDCWGVVTAYADGTGADEGMQSWTFTRSSAPNAGAMAAGTVVPVDSIVLDYGVSGNGIWETNAIDGIYGANSPYTQAVQWTTHPATGSVVRYRAGKLDGWGGGYSGTNTFGFAAGNVAGTWVAAEATNGFRVMYGNVAKGQWDTAGNLTIGEVGTGKSNVYITNAGVIYVRDNTSNKVRLSAGSQSTGFYTFPTVADFTGHIYVNGTAVMDAALMRGAVTLPKAGRINSTGAAIPIAFEAGQPHLSFEHWTLAGAAGLARIYTDSYQPNVGTIDFNSALVIESFAVNHHRWSDGVYVGNKGTQIILRAPAGANGGGGVSVEGALAATSNISAAGSITAAGFGTSGGITTGHLVAGNYVLAGNYTASSAGGIGAGLTTKTYSPTAGDWLTESTLILTAADYSTIAFHDSGNRVDFIRGGAGQITLGYNGGFGTATVYAPSTIRSDGGFIRNGVAGGIYVPIAEYSLTDTTGTTLNGSVGRAVGTYTITLNANGNNIPVGAKAVFVRFGAKWSAAFLGDGTYITLGDGASLCGAVRAVTSYFNDQHAIITINGSHQIICSVVGNNSNQLYVKVLGYFY